MVDGRSENQVSPFDSVDPAPPSKELTYRNRKHTYDENEKISKNGLICIENIGGHESVDALTTAFIKMYCSNMKLPCLGQMQDPHAPSLIDRLSDLSTEL